MTAGSANAAVAVSSPQISVGQDQVIGEADGAVDIPVTLSAPGLTTVTVQFQVLDLTATGFGVNADYTCPIVSCNPGLLTFAPGETLKTVHVPITDDITTEPLETFTVNLSTPTVGTIARGITQIAIVDNDNIVATPQLYVRDAIVDQAAGTASIPVIVGGTAGQAGPDPITVNYTTTNGTATAPADYATTSGSLTFAAGQTVQNVVVPIVASPGTTEGAERFTITLSTPTNATIADATGTVTIGAHTALSVPAPRMSTGIDTVVGEADGYVDIPVTLSAPGTSPVTTTYQVLSLTATGFGINADYTCPVQSCNPGVLTFAPGETLKTVRIPITNDILTEPLETFTLNLSAPTNATIARATTTITILSGVGQLGTLTLTPSATTVGADHHQSINLGVSWPGASLPAGAIGVKVCVQPTSAPAPAFLSCPSGSVTTAGPPTSQVGFTGLTPGVSYRSTAWPAFSGPNAGTPTNATRAGTRLVVPVAATITAGSSTTLTATLVVGATPLAAQSVVLWHKPAGATSWAVAATRTTNALGQASAIVKPSRTDAYEWRFAGSGTRMPTRATQTVRVGYAVTQRITRVTMALGGTTVLYGTVAPAATGQFVFLQRSGVTLAVKAQIVLQTLPSGVRTVGYRLSFKPAARGTYLLRAFKPATATNIAGFGPTVKLVVV